MKKIIAAVLVLFILLPVVAQRMRFGGVVPIKETVVHDPVMIKQDSTYYIFCTGNGISVLSSTNLRDWKFEAPVFNAPPKWAAEAIPAFKGHIWAPDISFYRGEYYLYYSVSAFGKNTSCIGLATNKTLNPADPAYQWVDHGKVIQSFPGVTNWNAIDPNFILDKDGTPYLSFGSFWDGLKLVKLSNDGKSVAEDVNQIPTIASRKKDPRMKENLPAVDNNPKDSGGNAIEAPFVIRKGKYYYLFASIDYCCKGEKSTYKMIIGRSKKLQGPYKDKENRPLAHGGGTILLAGDKDWYGVGHNGIASADGNDYLVFHAYDAHNNGVSKLRIEKLRWVNGWPEIIGD